MEFVIYPFSFAEFLELYRPIALDEPIQKCFQKYLLSGGMPYLANIRYEDAPSKLYLHDLFNSVQLKDIVTRNKIRDIDLLKRIIAYVIANVGTTFSATSLAKFFKNEKRTVAPETILNYIKYCCDAYLFYQVKREDLQGKQILASNEKYYIADHGIREAVFGGNMRDINLILENIVYLELLRRDYKVTVGRTGDKEIDFVCDKSDVGHSQRRSVCQAFFYSPFYGVPERIRTSDTRFRSMAYHVIHGSDVTSNIIPYAE